MSDIDEKDESLGTASRRDFSKFYDVCIFAVLLILCMFGSYLLLFTDNDTNVTNRLYNDRFHDPIEQSIGVAILKPIFVSIFQRVSTPAADADSLINGSGTYNERLVVVRPNNWMIYTADGINFHYITNNVNHSLSRCTVSNSLNAISYRLRKLNEKQDFVSDKLKFSCVNYTMDQLVRIFGSFAYRTDIDMTDYFDKNKRTNAPLFTVESILDFLIANALL